MLQKFGVGKKKQSFDHLILHSDAEGFYLPVDFEKVIIDEDLLGGKLGSSIRLKRELERIANWLDLDLSMNIDSEEVWEAPESQNNSPVKWKNFGVESYSCLNLYHACEESIKNDCAIVFC